MATPIPISIINSASSASHGLSPDASASHGLSPDADFDVDALVEATFAEWNTLGSHLSTDDAVAQDAPGLDELDQLFEEFCNAVSQQQSASEKHQKMLDDAIKTLDDLGMSQNEPQNYTTTMTTSTTTIEVGGCSSSAANAQEQGLIPTGHTAAVRHRMR